MRTHEHSQPRPPAAAVNNTVVAAVVVFLYTGQGWSAPQQNCWAASANTNTVTCGNIITINSSASVTIRHMSMTIPPSAWLKVAIPKPQNSHSCWRRGPIDHHHVCRSGIARIAALMPATLAVHKTARQLLW